MPFEPGMIRVQTCKPAPFVERGVTHNRVNRIKFFHMEPKLDGFRMVCFINARPFQNGVLFQSRSWKWQQKGSVPHLELCLPEIFPYDTILDGEITGIRFRDDGRTVENNFDFVQSVMNSYPERARELQNDYRLPLRYYIFDMLRVGGEDIAHLPLWERRERLKKYFAGETGADTGSRGRFEYVKMVPALIPSQERHDALVTMGYEGSVLKDRSRSYAEGKRGQGWIKIKAAPTVDVVIMGFDEGTGKFADTFGAIRFGQYSASGELIERGACSGLDDSQRAWMNERRGEMIGRVITIAHNGVIATNDDRGLKFRHPQFKLLRSEGDKSAEECTWHDY